jgi:hypothetical protein
MLQALELGPCNISLDIGENLFTHTSAALHAIESTQVLSSSKEVLEKTADRVS